MPGVLDLPGLVGAAWGRLPGVMRRRFEPGHGGIRFRGTMDMERSWVGAGFAVLARVLGAPLPLRTVRGAETGVRVREVAGGVEWERRMGGQVVRSVKSPGPGGTVLERTQGGLGMVLDVGVEGRALVFTSRGFFWEAGRWRVPVPGVVTPGRCRVSHEALAGGLFRFTLTMTHPWWGVTVRQDGIFSDVEA